MKRSQAVPASLIVTLAAGMSGCSCGTTTYWECHDAYGRLMPDAYCRSGYAGSHWISIRRSGFGSTGSSTGGSFGS